MSEKADLDFLESEIEEWKGIQLMINESQEKENYWIIHHSWSSDIPYLHLYHTLVEDSLCTLGKHIMPKLERNWMEGTHRSSKTSTN